MKISLAFKPALLDEQTLTLDNIRLIITDPSDPKFVINLNNQLTAEEPVIYKDIIRITDLPQLQLIFKQARDKAALQSLFNTTPKSVGEQRYRQLRLALTSFYNYVLNRLHLNVDEQTSDQLKLEL